MSAPAECAGWPVLKGRFPFRVGAPSYVFPADVLPNVRALADVVDDVEIVLFESDAVAPLPDVATVQELAALARAKNLTYTVHLPLDADVGRRDEDARREAVGRHLRAIARTAALDPHGLVLHCPAPSAAEGGAACAGWHTALARSARELLAAGLDPRRICIETLDYPLQEIDGLLREFDFSVCLDVGHAVLHGQALGALVERYFGRTRVIHLHGVAQGKDHRAISAVDPAVWAVLKTALHAGGAVPRVLTLEVFTAARLGESLEVLDGWMGK